MKLQDTKIPIVLIAIIWVFVFILKEDFDNVFWVFTTVSFSFLFLSMVLRKYVKIFLTIELFFWVFFFAFFDDYMLLAEIESVDLLSPYMAFNKELRYMALIGALVRIYNVSYFIFRWSWKVTCVLLIAGCSIFYFITMF
jgi:hypothetical protein